MSAKRYPIIDESIVRSLAEVLGRTDGGLTNKQIDELLAAAGIADPTPPVPRGTYVMISKRDRLFNALSARQHRDGCGNSVLAFVGTAGVAKVVVPGVQVLRTPSKMASAHDRDRQRRVQTEFEAPMIPDLIAGDREFSGPEGYVPYIEALKTHCAAYEPVSAVMRTEWLAGTDDIKRLREAARERLWPRLHNDWLPRMMAERDGEFVRRDFPRLIKWATRGAPFAQILDNTPLQILIGCVSGAALDRATNAVGIPVEVAGGAAALAAGTAGVRYRAHVRDVTDLAVFYQCARRSR